jgi:hypothetical protein
MPGLALSDVVNVSVNLTPLAVPVRNFGVLCIAGASDVIDVSERVREYATLDEVVSDFGSTAPEYLAADLYFSQNPTPSICYVGRFAQTPTSAILKGQIFSSAQQAQLLTTLNTITNGTMTIPIDGTARAVGPSAALLNSGFFTVTDQTTLLTTLQGISNGGFTITVNGTVQHPANINFSAIQTLTDAATAIQAALTNATCTWSASNAIFTITSTTQGVASTLSYASAPAGTPINTTTTGSVASGATVLPLTSVTGMAANMPISASGIPAGATIISIAALNVTISVPTTATMASGTAVSVATPGTGTDVSAPLRLSATTGAFLTQGTAGMNFSGITNLNGAASIVSSALPGARCRWDGTRFIIESTSGGVTSTLGYASSTGSGQDVSLMLGLTNGRAVPPVNGIAAETPLACATALRAHPEWYGLTFAPPANALLSTSDQIAVAGFIEGCQPYSIFGYTTQDTLVLASTVTNDIASSMQALGFTRTFGQYSLSSPYAVCAMFGRAFTVDFQGQNTVITLKFKQEPGVAAEQLTETQASTLQTKRCNVFVGYANDAAIIQEGVMASGMFFDERHNSDWLQNQISTDLFNTLYTSPTKIPQTDAGVHVLTATVANSCNIGVQNGMIAPGQWNGPPLGQISTGQQLPAGFYVYAPKVASQPQSIREQRIAPTIQALVKLAGAIHFADCIVNVNR